MKFKDTLIELPAAYGKAPEYRDLPIVEIVQRSKEITVSRLAPRTVQRHLSALACLWEAAVEAGECQATVFGNFKLPTAKRAKDQRDMWSSEQLDRLFATPVWRGCASITRRSKPGDLIVRDEKFWLPLIALFSGMRQEEICQLHVEDVRQIEGLWVFDVNDVPPRQLKNRNARRLVPVHQRLIALGLLTYLDQIRAAGETRLFPRLQPGGADRRFGHNFSKWFARYRREVGLAHETVHWTGAKKRLDRDLQDRFGTEAYAMEELVAELGSAFLAARLGIAVEPRPDHAAYIASWLKVLRDDSRAILTASAKAQQAVDYLEGLQQPDASTDTPPTAIAPVITEPGLLDALCA